MQAFDKQSKMLYNRYRPVRADDEKTGEFTMKIITVKDPLAGGKAALEIFKAAKERGVKTFGLATGGTPETTYTELVKSDLDFRDCVSVNLDEYVGLPTDNDQSYAYYMHEHLFKAKPFAASYLPNGMASDLASECARYDQIIADHHVGLQLLGIGRNGHIGFNEPGSPFNGTTHEAKLTESTIAANARFFDREEDVPKQAISMGIGSIMQADQILLEAYGEKKADAVAKMIQGPVTEEVPASVLQRHPDVIVIVDEAAAIKLK